LIFIISILTIAPALKNFLVGHNSQHCWPCSFQQAQISPTQDSNHSHYNLLLPL